MADAKLKILINAEDHASGTLSGIGRALSGIGGIAKGALVAGAGLAAGAIAGLGVALVDATREAMKAEEVQAQLNAVLTSTGGIAGVTADMANDLADSLSKVTRFEDEAIISGESLLLTFTNIGKDIFPETTEVMLDMSQALGQDLKSSALQLGKALNDPIRGVTALTRVGVSFTEAQKEQIKALQDSGDLMGAQKIILAELQREFGGAARAAGQTFAGQLDILKNQLGNVKEEVGTALLPVLTELATTFGPVLIGAAGGFADFAIGVLVPAIQQAATWIQTNWPLIQATAEQVWGRVREVVGGAVAFIQGLFGGGGLGALPATWSGIWAAVRDTAVQLWTALTGLFEAGRELIAGVLTAIGDQSTWLGTTWQQVSGIIGSAVTMAGDIISGVLSAVGEFVQEHGDVIRSIIVNTWEAIKAAISGALGVIQGIINTVAAVIRGDWAGAWAGIQQIVGAAWETIQGVVGAAVNILASILGEHGAVVKTLFANVWTAVEGIVGAALGVIQGIINTVTAAIQGDWAGAWNGLLDIVSSVWETIKATISGAMNIIAGLLGIQLPNPFAFIAGAASAAIDAINSVIGKLQEWFGLSAQAPAAPSGGAAPATYGRNYQMGTPWAPGGWALVGERGPELVRLPASSRVYPAEQSARMMTQPAWNVTLNITGARDPVAVGREAQAGVLRAARALGVR